MKKFTSIRTVESFRGRTASGKPPSGASSVKYFAGTGWYVTNPVNGSSGMVNEIFAGPYPLEKMHLAQSAGEHLFGDEFQAYDIVYLDKDGDVVTEPAGYSDYDDPDYDDINDPPY